MTSGEEAAGKNQPRRLAPREVCWPPIYCILPNPQSSQGYGYSYVRDPAYLHVNSVTTTINFFWSPDWDYGCTSGGEGLTQRTNLLQPDGFLLITTLYLAFRVGMAA
jgi:hypothetical protein